MQRKSKLAGLSTLALAGVLAFTGCSKDDEKKIEKIELIESGVSSNKYKVTYTDGSSETVVSNKDIISKEEMEEAYIKAITNSYAGEVMASMSTVTGSYMKLYKYAYYQHIYYEEDDNHKEYRFNHHVDLESGRWASELYRISKEDGSKYKSTMIDDIYHSKDYVWERTFGMRYTIEEMTEEFMSYNYMGIQDRNIISFTYEMIDGKYVLTMMAEVKNNNGAISKGILKITFSDKIESKEYKYTFRNEDGSGSDEVDNIIFDYSVDESIKNVDFTTFS